MIPSFDHDMHTIKEVAESLRCSERTVRNRIREGKIGYVRFGHNLFVPKCELKQYIKEHQFCRREAYHHL